MSKHQKTVQFTVLPGIRLANSFDEKPESLGKLRVPLNESSLVSLFRIPRKAIRYTSNRTTRPMCGGKPYRPPTARARCLNPVLREGGGGSVI